jgi:hypothetical protein
MRNRAIQFGSAALLLSLAVNGCTKAQTSSESTAYAVLDALSAASGAEPTKFAGTLASDVLTLVKKTENGKEVRVPTIFEDLGRATLHLALRDPGTADKPTTPSPANTLTFTRYHINYVRADGRNVPGVDVPYPFDGGLTISVVAGNVSIGQLVVVRGQAKDEAPLKALIGGGGQGFISTIAEITFYGTDQAGRAVSVMGRMNIDFADWGDPD